MTPTDTGNGGAADADELGPIDYAVVELAPGRSTITGELAMELGALADAGVIRVLDLVVVHKASSGAVEGFEIEDLDHADEVRALAADVAEVLTEQDLLELAETIAPGRSAAVLVWENTWASPLVAAAREAGGAVVASGRIPVDALVASLRTDRPVLGAPVVRSGAGAGTAAIVVRGLDRRRERRSDRPGGRPALRPDRGTG